MDGYIAAATAVILTAMGLLFALARHHPVSYRYLAGLLSLVMLMASVGALGYQRGLHAASQAAIAAIPDGLASTVYAAVDQRSFPVGAGVLAVLLLLAYLIALPWFARLMREESEGKVDKRDQAEKLKKVDNEEP